MKHQYKEINFRPATIEYLREVSKVIKEFKEMGYKLTLRQLFYQLVSLAKIPNTAREYAKLSRVLVDARMGGDIDWDIIEDRIRTPNQASDWETCTSLMDSAINSFRLPRWEDQDYYVEVWTEKDALTSILEPITREYHVPLIVNRGYSSASAMYRAGKRFLNKCYDDKVTVILYLGDHDPSGLDMDRDIEDRMCEFGADNTRVERIGLTMEQVEEYNPPPNYAKMTDPRADDYMAEHGEFSWEVDALRPNVLDQLLRDAIEEYIDMDKYNAMIAKEDELKERILIPHRNQIEEEEENE